VNDGRRHFDRSSISLAAPDTAFVADARELPAGTVYVFTRSGTTWSIQQKLYPSDGTAAGEFG
jgi:hypothetical protein